MSKKVKFTVDGKIIEAEEGAILLQVLLEHGFNIPYYCYHEALGPDGNCRMCMVEIEGKKRPQISCDTFVEEGLVVRTDTENIRKVRRGILELQLINHPVDCPICDQAGECSLQDYYMDYGLYHGKVDKAKKLHFKKHLDLGANVMLDQERCVLCQRCTRFTSNITKTNELGIVRRGDLSRVDTMPGRKLHNGYAMNIVDLCPVGALTSKDFRFQQRVWFLTSTPSVCHGCAKGCNIFIDHARLKYQDDTIYRFRPRKNPDINGHFICDAGRLGYKRLQHGRLKEALSESGPIGFEEAEARLKTLLEAHNGPIVVLADANLFTEELEMIRIFSNEIGAALHAPLESYIDDEFKDDWLKQPMRAANARGVERLAIDTTMPEVEEGVLLINFNHPAADTLDVKRRIDFLTHRPKRESGTLLTLPIAVWSETAGTLVNVDGIAQRCEQAIFPNEPVPTVLRWLEAFDLGERCVV
ncbi:2Fe-2S iron-sulfur cluster-binding protein [Hydrogenimonas urashimensis]|uniref:2Fe-2S iron-sulfur cluster-binding protein n=1 Tax=Hydrogenimonas urashimensis TaxID=2740515 RepID=UPI001915319D|nr:2Fe-2S iron-sulfur cluster-binding protein [Hydrogenimonas urashimensis]